MRRAGGIWKRPLAEEAGGERKKGVVERESEARRWRRVMGGIARAVARRE